MYLSGTSKEFHHPQLQPLHMPFLSFTLWITVLGSSTDISEDWEKDFDLDMTEEEVQMALSKVDASGEVSGPAGGGPQGSKPNDPGLRTLPTKPYCPLSVHTFPSEAAGCGKGAKTFRLGPEQWSSAGSGSASPEFQSGGWRQFLTLVPIRIT